MSISNFTHVFLIRNFVRLVNLKNSANLEVVSKDNCDNTDCKDLDCTDHNPVTGRDC